MFKKNKIIFFPLIFIGFFLFSDDMGIPRWYKLRKERNQLQEEINILIKKENELKNEINLLNNDNEYIKKLAQEKFHMVKSGEKVFRVINKKQIK